MKRWTPVTLFLLFFVLLFPAGSPALEEFSFHGLQFGMRRDQVDMVMPLAEGVDTVKNPSHGMSSLDLGFDPSGRLMEIKASYLRPDDPLRSEGLKRALKEKFVSPVKAAYPHILVVMDEYANRATFTLSFLSRTIKEENIEFSKTEFLKKIE